MLVIAPELIKSGKVVIEFEGHPNAIVEFEDEFDGTKEKFRHFDLCWAYFDESGRRMTVGINDAIVVMSDDGDLEIFDGNRYCWVDGDNMSVDEWNLNGHHLVSCYEDVMDKIKEKLKAEKVDWGRYFRERVTVTKFEDIFPE